MPRNGAYSLGEVRAARVVVECEQCDRRGDYSTQRLLQRFGPDIGMPQLKPKLVTCPNRELRTSPVRRATPKKRDCPGVENPLI